MCRVIFEDVFETGELHVTKRQLTSVIMSTGMSSRALTLRTFLLPAISPSLPLGIAVEASAIAPMQSGLGVAVRTILRGSILFGSTEFLGR